MPGIRRVLAAALTAAFSWQTTVVATAPCELDSAHAPAAVALGHDHGNSGAPVTPTPVESAGHPDSDGSLGMCATCVAASLPAIDAVNNAAPAHGALDADVLPRLPSVEVAPEVPPPRF